MLNDKWYDIVKYVTQIALPALATFYVALAGIWGWSMATEVAGTITAIVTFLSALLGLSSVVYYKSNAEDTTDAKHLLEEIVEEGDSDE